ncbi:MAG: Fe-S cluster assembly protein SufD [Propionibacteriaceae bacterium]|nr:Fe-S cluster assembly protein SufD [Propionibacteriaceae bacterium]
MTTELHPQGSFDVADFAVPTGKEEVWRFTPLDRLGEFFNAPADSGSLTLTTDAHLEVLGVGEAVRGTVLVPPELPSALAAGVAEADYLVLDSVADQPVRITMTGDSHHLSHQHLVIDAKPYSQTTVLLTYQGLAHHNATTEILVGEGAHLSVVSLHDWDPGTLHLGHTQARVGKDATYRHIVVSLGGDLVRANSFVSYEAPGGRAELLGVYFADAAQHLEHRLFVDHNQPKTTSHVDYRGALNGTGATSIWVGDVLIRSHGEGINTYETNKILLLSEGCRAEAVPNLEIETGEILGAGHSASTGRFDPEQLFYLRSRGISESEARRMVVRGFFASILSAINIDDVEESLLRRIDEELGFDKEK